MINKAIEMITAQMQDDKENSLIQEIGKSLITLCKTENTSEIIVQDLCVEGMNLKACYKAFYDHASKNKSGGCFAGSEALAEQLIRDFYGIHSDNKSLDKPKQVQTKFSLADFMK